MEVSESQDLTRSQHSYVSCMKINGVPLLPPLMTQEYKQEMQYYKKLALAVEKRISDLKTCLEEDSTLYSNNHPSDTEECFDGTNISYDPQDRSSFSERQSSQAEQDEHWEQGKFDEFFENNEFESMNSQVTIIDISSEPTSQNPTESTDMSYVKVKTDTNKESDNKSSGLQNSLVQTESGIIVGFSEQVILSDSNKINPPESPIKAIISKNEEEKKDLEKSSNKSRIQKSPFVLRTPSKDAIKVGLDNSSSRINTKKNIPANSPVKVKKVTPHKKENVSPIIHSKKVVTKTTKDLSMYEPKKLQKKSLPVLRHKLSPAKNITGSLNNISSGLISPPKLVRQNSYTLEYPSPLLLAHLEVQSITSGIDVRSISMSESSNSVPVARVMQGKEKDLKPSHDDTALNKGTHKTPDKSVTQIKSTEKKCFDSESISSIEPIDHKIIEAHWDDYNRLCKTVLPNAQSSPNCKFDKADRKEDQIQNEFENKLVSNGIEMMSDINPSSKESPVVYVDVILKRFQEDHEKQMSALLKKQQEEQLLLRKTFENQQKLLIEQFQTEFTSRETTYRTQSSLTKHSKSDKSISDSSENQFSPQSKESVRSSRDVSNDDSMEKYLMISADVLNASRSLLINKKTVNLSPTDIQCVNVVPSQDISSSDRNSSYRSKDSSVRTALNRNDYSSSSEFINDKGKSYFARNKNDTTLDSNKSFDRGDEPPDTARTNNTLDDLNFTFSSDDGAHVNNYYNDSRNEYYSNMNPIYNRNSERDNALTKARNKINEIQKNLSSYALAKRSERSQSEMGYDFNSEHSVSLSAINVVPNRHYPKNFADRNHLSLDLNDINQPSGMNFVMKQNYKSAQEIEKERLAATKIVSWCKGYLTRRLMKTERVESTVQTIRDALLCALQMHSDQDSIQGPDIDLHRRLIQQITAACYTLHDIFIESTPDERMRLIRQDRERKMAIMQRSFTMAGSSPHHRHLSATTQRVLKRKMDAMSRSHTGAFSSRSVRSSHYPANVMTGSHYEQSDHMRCLSGSKESGGHRRTLSVTGDTTSRRPWR